MITDEYRQLVLLTNRATQAATSGVDKVNPVESGLKAAKATLHFARHHPDAALSAFAAAAHDKSIIHIPAFKTALIIAILSYRSQLNEHYAQHLIGASFCLTACLPPDGHADIIDGKKSRLVNLLAQKCARLKLSLWRDIIKTHRLVNHERSISFITSGALNDSQRWFLLAAYIAKESPKQPLSQIIRQIVSYIPARFHTLMAQWLSFPGEYLPGSQCVYHGDRIILLTVSKKCLGAVRFHAHAPPEFITLSSEELCYEATSTVTLANWSKYAEKYTHECKALQSPDWPYALTFPVSYPPARLLRIIDMLHKSDTDIPTLVTEVTQEPLFSKALTQAATQDNRMQLPVNDVKQAVLTYGFERVGDMLVQQALTQRLTQRFYPLEHTCYQFSALAAGVASCLATMTKSRLTSESAGLISTFLTGPLFSIPALKILCRFPHSELRHFDINCLIKLAPGMRLSDLAKDLAKSWHQPQLHIAIISQMGKLPAECPESIKREYGIIMLSLYWSRKWLFASSPPCSDTQEALNQASTLLNLDEDTEAILQEQFSHQIFTHLSL